MKEYRLKSIKELEREGMRPELSIFLPVYDEEENIEPLNRKLKDSLEQLGRTYEIIYVDDGSTDGSLARLREIAAADARVRVIALRR
ncbi:MAG TPA: glycosyltransferase, partial [Blastocatellia bacterium]